MVRGTPSSHDGGYPPPSRPGQRVPQGTPHPDLGWGTPPPGTGYPPPTNGEQTTFPNINITFSRTTYEGGSNMTGKISSKSLRYVKRRNKLCVKRMDLFLKKQIKTDRRDVHYTQCNCRDPFHNLCYIQISPRITNP